MKQPVDIGNYVLVDVPEGANGFVVQEMYDALTFYQGAPSFANMRDIALPQIPGNYQIVGLAKDIDAKTWDEIFPDKDGGRFLDQHNLRLETTLFLKKIL